MPINFPTSLDSLTNPLSTDTLNSPSHSTQHSNANDAIEALEAKVGVDSSAVTTSHDYKLGEITGADKAVGKTATQTLTNKTLTSPVINTPTGIVKGDVGLGNVDNTSDATKNSAVATLTNKTIALGSNTISGTLAEFNAALTGADFATGGGTASGTNTGDQTSIVGITGTIAQFNTALTDGDFATLAGSESLSNKTLVTPVLGVATATSINKVAITAPATSATLTLADGSTLVTSGANSITLTSTGATNVTLPTTGTLATLAGTEELDNKTLDSSVGKGTWTASGTWTLPAVTLGDTVLVGGGASATEVRFLEPSGSGTNYTALKAQAQGANITYTLPATVASAGQVLTDAAGNGTLSWATPSATSTPTLMSATSYEASGRFSTTVTGTGTNTFGTYGNNLVTGTNGSSKVIWTVNTKNNTQIFNGSPVAAWRVDANTLHTTLQAYMGLGNVTVASAGLTYTVAHIGFKLVASGGATSLYATQADGTTENASSALTTVADNDVLDLILKVNGSASVDYYWRLNGGTLSSATNLTSNMPTITTAVGVNLVGISSVGNTGSSDIDVSNASYQR